MDSLHITVPEPMRRWVSDRVGSGDYVDESDYVRDLIRHDQRALAEEESWRPGIEDALADLEAGRAAPADAVFDRLDRKYRAMVDEGSTPAG